MLEYADNRTFRHHDGDGVGRRCDRSRCDMTAPQAERHFHIRSVRVQESSGGEKDSVSRYNKSTIQLGKFLDRAPQFVGRDVPSIPRMSFQGVKNQRARPRHYSVCIADCKQGADAPPFPALTSNLDSQFEERAKNLLMAVGEL